jgi:mannose-1-phosphate guanylyltransferase
MNHNSAPQFTSIPLRLNDRERFAVVLAGGDGSRLKSLTRVITGDERPKQFCPIFGDRTLLDETRRRVSLLMPAENIYFSLTQKHEPFFRGPLWGVREIQKIVQPENKGTAPAILYSLLRIARTSPDATVAFFPSDHYVSDDEAFMASVESAMSAAELESDSIVLIGIEPENPETSYGWIEPERSLFGELPCSVTRVKRFWEKPHQNVANRLLDSGCLWNSFVMVGKVGTFLTMFKRHLPDMVRMVTLADRTFGTLLEPAAIRAVYERLSETNFSSEVLERSADTLFVMRVQGVGWNDLGEPQRVLGTLVNLGVQNDWMRAAA